jgi:hypothetical protein
MGRAVSHRFIIQASSNHFDSKPVLLVNQDDRIIAVLAGRPLDSGRPGEVPWAKACAHAASAIDTFRARLPAHKIHRRGDFPAVATGISMGTGASVRCPC